METIELVVMKAESQLKSEIELEAQETERALL